MKKILAIALTLALGIFGLLATSVSAQAATPGDSASNPIVVTNVSDVPEGAVEDNPSTYVTDAQCDTTRSWVVSGKDAVTHLEWGSEERTRTYTPAVAQVEHKEYKFTRTVKDYKTQYHFRKFTHTKTKAKNAKNWSDYGPWTAWEPETHTSWQDSTDPLGTPQFHGEGTYKDGTKWYRQWQAQFDGKTRSVVSGEHTENTGWVTEKPAGDGWKQVDEKTVVDVKGVPESYGDWTEWTVRDRGLKSEPVLPENTSTHEYRKTGPVTVTDSEAVAPVYYAWSDNKVCETSTPTPTDTPSSTPTPTETPSNSPSPSASVTPDVTPTAHSTVSPSPSETPQQRKMLAQTGNDWMLPAALIAVLLVLGGAGMVKVARTRKH